MKKIILAVVLLMMMAFSVYAEDGDLIELMHALGDAKSFILRLEKNKGEGEYNLHIIIERISEQLKKAKELLAKYDYPNEKAIKEQVDDYEKRYAAIVMSL